MADTLKDELEVARVRLEAALGEMTGASPQSVSALGTILSRGDASETVAKEFALLSAHMAIDPSAFYGVAFIRAQAALSAIRSALTAALRLTDGPNSLLRWTRAARAPRSSVEDLDALIRRIRAARFARSETTETVNSEILDAARAAAEALQRRLDQPDEVSLPSAQELTLLVELLHVAESAAWGVLGLRSAFETHDFRGTALLRVLERAEVALLQLSPRIQGGDRDTEAEVEALAEVTALEAAVDALARARSPFGELLVLDATASPSGANLVGEPTLIPLPERARGGRVYSGTVDAHPGDASKRLLSVPPSGAWVDANAVSQRIEIAHDERTWFVETLAPAPRLVARGQGTIGGDPYFPDVLDGPSSGAPGEIDPYTSTAALPVAALFPGSYAYVAEVGRVDVYVSDGATWVLGAEDVDHRRNRFMLAEGFPLGAEAVAGQEVRISSTDAEIDDTFSVVQSGPPKGASTYLSAFGVTLNTHLSNEAGKPVQWEAYSSQEGEPTDRFRAPAGSLLSSVPSGELIGRAVTLWQDGEGWTHRFIEEVTPVGGSVDVVFDEPLPYADARLFMSEVPGFDYPWSPFVRAYPQAGEPLDVRAGDVVVADVGGATETRVVQHALGNAVLLSSPLITDPDFASEVGSFRRGGEARAVSTAGPSARAEATRYRGILQGDRVLALPTVQPPTPPGWTDPLPGEAYTVSALTPDGIELKPGAVESAGPLPRTYGRMVVWPGAETSTNLFRVEDGPSSLSSVERLARRLKSADDPDGQLDDVWPLQTVSIRFRGEPVEAERVGPDMLRLSAEVPVYLPPEKAEFRVLMDTESRRASLEMTDASVSVTHAASAGSTPAIPVSAATHTSLPNAALAEIEAGEFPAGAAEGAVVDVRYRDPLTAELSGPITRGGPREFGFYAWSVWKLRQSLQNPPSYRELKEDIGRAAAELGSASRGSYAADSTAIDGAVASLSLTEAPGNPSLLEGADYLDGVQRQTPLRVIEVLDAAMFPAEVTVRLTGQPGATGAVTLRDTTIAQAWRELRATVTHLDALNAALSAIIPPESEPVSAAVRRLESAGYSAAAASVREAKFSEWSDAAGVSDRADLAARMESLVSSLLSRRNSPLDVPDD